MYVVGQDEIDAVTKVIKSQSLFRYGIGDECERFESRYAKYLGCSHFMLAASGSNTMATRALIDRSPSGTVPPSPRRRERARWLLVAGGSGAKVSP